MLLREGNLNAAIVSFQEGLAYDPEAGLAYQRLAEAQTVAGKTADAAATYRKLLYLWPGKSWTTSQAGDPSVYMRFALVLQRLHLETEALTVYQKGWQKLPTDRGPLPPLFTAPDFPAADFRAAAYTAMGLYTTFWSDPGGGEADFERAIATQPSLATPYFYRGLIHKGERGRAADAVADFRRAAQLDAVLRPSVDKAMQDGTTEFTTAVRKAQADAAP